MTKNTARRKKRKNLKLRRTIRKTVAALIMIMAVIVAAIPVENLGTMQAQTRSSDEVEVADIYSTYQGNMKDTDEENDLFNDVLSGVTDYKYDSSKDSDYYTTIKIEPAAGGDSTYLNWEFKAVDRNGKQSGTETVIVDYNRSDAKDTIVVGDTLYTKYFVITEEHINAVEEILKAETYKVQFQPDESSSSETNLVVPGIDGDASCPQYTISLKKLSPTLKDVTETYQSKTVSGKYLIDVNKNDFNAINVYKEHTAEYLNAVNQIKIYNNILDILFEKVNENKNSMGSIAYGEIKALYDDAKRKYEKYSQPIEIKYENVLDKYAFIRFCLKNRFSFLEGVTKAYSLKGFELESINDKSSISGEYIPRWEKQKGGATYQEDLQKYDENDTSRSQKLDADGYIQLDSITVSGIGNEVFKGFVDFDTIVFPETIEFIGNDAFSGCTKLKAIDLTNVLTVGNRAFKDCTSLKNITFTSSQEVAAEVQVLGAEAFYGTGLTSIQLPGSIRKLGYGCFAESSLTNIEIPGGTNAIEIWPFAFYNCSDLVNVKFPEESFANTITLGMGAFAVKTGGEMTSFSFPASMKVIIQDEDADNEFNLDSTFTALGMDKSSELYYDHILAGRSSLKTVTLPIRMGTKSGTKIPDNTLQGCSSLECFTFGQKCLNETNGYTTYDPEKLFRDVENQKFYVEGPGFLNQQTTSTFSKPRELTVKVVTATPNYSVPYIFISSYSPDVTRIEMSVDGNDNCLAILEDIDDNPETKDVKLIEYTYNGTENIKDLVVSSKIGSYNLVSLGKGCFSDVKDYVLELIIEDGSVETIEESAFEGSTTLQKVTIGSSVRTIGDKAFYNCIALENVYFNSPTAVLTLGDEEDWETKALSIGKEAFYTNSDYLTFYGDIHTGYQPFELAADGYKFSNTAADGTTICYKTGSPKHLTAIYDHERGLCTLIDYPHYEEIDTMNDVLRKQMAQKNGQPENLYRITDNFEANNSWKELQGYTPSGVSDSEMALINAVFDIELPKGIQSIDVKNYINYSGNKSNVDYLYLTYEEQADGKYKRDELSRILNPGNEIQAVYSDDKVGSGSDITTAGLFSGYYKDDDTGIVPGPITESKTYKSKTMHAESATAGNDQLLSIDLNSISYLPDYAFESCENLSTVRFGSELNTLGNVPFRDCFSLMDVDTSENKYFTSVNSIIYKNPMDGTNDGYTIEECLVTRGTGSTGSVISSSIDEKIKDVTAIEPEAFSYCTNLQMVDLSDTKIGSVPEGCFKGDTALTEVVLPKTVSSIDSKAFSGTKAQVYIYSTTCQIESDAFDNGNGIIYGYKYVDGSSTNYSTAYTYAQKHGITFKEIDAEYTLTFLDFDGSLIETQRVDAGKDGKEPDWTPTRTGYDFKEWSWEKTESDGKLSIVTGDAVYRNVTENRTILATYTVGNGIVSDGKDYDLKIEGGKNIAGETTMKIKGGTAVSIIADEKSGSTFQYWSESTGKWAELFENIHSDVTTFIMPNETLTITAHYTDGSTGSGTGNGSGSGSGNGSGSGSGTGTTETKYKLTVNYGSGTGEYKAGEVVSISAFAPESSSKVFSKWTTTNTGVGFANASSATTTLTMPAAAVTVTANYKTRTVDDEDDSELEALNKRKPTSTTTTVTPGANNATVTTTTGTVTNTTPNVTTNTTTPIGDNITINKGGISNTGVASTQVEGAADNFVVKVTDSSSAVSEAETALKDKFGSLDGILYFPMDISLYDVTGKNLITDTTGLDVNVTLPIPDELIQYGGNVRVAAIENGKLQDLNVRFTTIDGIACMSFVPPHFSPYVIYVDTNNLVAGQMLDSTPKTGDPIHPKWFLAIGMACLSVILFTTGDKKKKVRKVTA